MSRIVRQQVPLFIILLAALAIRLIFFTGMVRGDALNYSHAAYELSEGRTDFGDWGGTSRIGLYAPVAFLYLIFGSSEATNLAFPIIASLLSVIFVYALARMVAGHPAGLLSAVIWAFLPLDVHLSTTLLPDSPVAALSTGAVYFLFLGERSAGRKAWLNYLLSVVFLLWAILVKPIALVTLLFFVLFIGLRLWKKYRGRILTKINTDSPELRQRYLVVGIILFFTLGLVYAQIQLRPFVVSLARTAHNLGDFFVTGATELDFSDQRFSQSDLLLPLTPLFLVAIIVLYVNERKTVHKLLLWLAAVYVYYEWGTYRLNALVYSPFESFIEARTMLFVLAPFVVVTGIYLGKRLDERVSNILIPLVALFVLLIAWLVKPALYAGQIPGWIQASTALLVLGAFLSPILVLRATTQQRNVIVPVFLFFLSVAALKPVMPYHALMYANELATLENYRKTLDYWDAYPTGKIFVENQGQAMKLNYASNFQLGYDWAGTGSLQDTRLEVGIPPPLDESEGYAITMNARLDLDDAWQLQEVYEGAPGKSIYLYRAVNSP